MDRLFPLKASLHNYNNNNDDDDDDDNITTLSQRFFIAPRV